METSYILFKSYYHLHQEEMNLNLLKNEGFEAYITDKTMGSFSFLGPAICGVKLYVEEKDLERSHELLFDILKLSSQ